MKVYHVSNSDGMVVKVCSTLEKAREFISAHWSTGFDYSTLRSSVVEFEVDGDVWGTLYYWEEEDQMDTLAHVGMIFAGFAVVYLIWDIAIKPKGKGE